jgi:hypothetical protein
MEDFTGEAADPADRDEMAAPDSLSFGVQRIMEGMPVRIDSPFFFVNPRGKPAGKRYSHCVIRILRHEASRNVGVEINAHSCLKRSSCSQFVSEKDYLLDPLRG